MKKSALDGCSRPLVPSLSGTIKRKEKKSHSQEESKVKQAKKRAHQEFIVTSKPG